MASCTSPKDVLELGQAISRELRLDPRGDILERWLAHHLAELMANAGTAVGAKKIQAQKAAVDLILKLWSHRRALPKDADPLGHLREAIEVLAHLVPPANPWAHHPSAGHYDTLLRSMFRTMGEAVLFGVLLTQVTTPRSVSAVERNFLDERENLLLDAFQEWFPLGSPSPVPTPIVTFYTAGEEPDPEESPDESLNWEGLSPEEQRKRATEGAKGAIESLLVELQSQIGTLLDRWRKHPLS
jgi:ABC-type cobalt transport system substrate-binding protein